MKIYNRELDIGDWNREPEVLTPARTEEGKRIRKEIGDRGGITFEHKVWKPRADGIANTLTMIVKDNILLIPEATRKGYIEAPPGSIIDLSYPASKTRRGRVQGGGQSPRH